MCMCENLPIEDEGDLRLCETSRVIRPKRQTGRVCSVEFALIVCCNSRFEMVS